MTIGRRTRSKTRSDTKASDRKPLSAGHVYFLDESIAGHRLIQAMRDAGAQVVPLFDEFERGTPDPVWLPVVTSRGWILLTKDDKWRYRHEEMMILIRAKARAFVFVSKPQSVPRSLKLSLERCRRWKR
ncbi:MAG TPA: hypothetical protein VGS96_10950 [Thermoanaerobaculia bacterium]|nr:hypothetical protein [Thermoanaerobaculia bacterium]